MSFESAVAVGSRALYEVPFFIGLVKDLKKEKKGKPFIRQCPENNTENSICFHLR